MQDCAAKIRLATTADAAAISDLTIRALRETNAKDYEPDILEAVIANSRPTDIAARIDARTVILAAIGEDIVGTASLDGSTIRSVFVRPDRQKTGVGAHMMREIEKLARMRGVEILTVPSSVTAIGFYHRLGFATIRDEFEGRERIVTMAKSLATE